MYSAEVVSSECVHVYLLKVRIVKLLCNCTEPGTIEPRGAKASYLG